MKRSIPFFVLTFCLLLLSSVAPGKTNPRTCGSGPEKREELRLVAEQNRRLRPRTKQTQSNPARTAGEMVIMEAADGIVSERNIFNLDQRRIAFSPSANSTAYRFEPGDAAFIEPAADDRALTSLEDDDAADSALPFPFPYFGQRYDRVWINSDGNLSFDRPDTASADRSLGRFTSGPPRLAPLFTDLDPSRAGSVVISESKERFTVTWLRVPEYRSAGTGSPNTFQVTLYPDGRVEFHFRGVTALDAVVGIARGRLEGAASVVSFLNGASTTFTSSIAERFSLGSEIDMVTLSQRFFSQFDDAYDYLVVYNNMGISPGAGVVAFEVTVRNDRLGYGDREVDEGLQYGSRRRLQAVLNLGPLNQYPVDPNALVPSRASSRDTPLSILGHEAGHLFLAFASVRDAGNPVARPMLGTQNAHWTFGFNSEASLLEGNRIRDLGPGATPRFETVGSSEGYAPLDQYLMGMRAPAEVPPTFLVESATLGFFARPPQTGVRFDGLRRDIAVGELIEAEGRRTPDHTVAQRRFRFAFVLLVTPGTEPTPEQVAQVERYRAEFGPYYDRMTGGRGAAETTIREALAFSTQPAGGVVTGGTAEIRIEVARPGPVEVALVASPGGLLWLPERVTIPAGATSALVRVTGANPGVADIVATAAGDRHETARIRFQVRDAASAGLRAWVRDGDRQVLRSGRPLDPIVVRVVDENRVPYPGVPVTGAPLGGRLETDTLMSDEQGEVRFRFLPGRGPVNEASFSVGGSAQPPARAVLLSTPFVADGGVVNAASFSPGLSPGALVTLFGANLTASREPAGERFPGTATLNGTQVFVGDRSARLLYVSDRQINFVMPATVEPAVQEVEIRNSLGISERKPVSVEAAWPGIFSASARPDGLIRIVATGLGRGLDVRATVGDFAGEVVALATLPGGEIEVTVRPPAQAKGTVPVRLLTGNRSSNALEVVL